MNDKYSGIGMFIIKQDLVLRNTVLMYRWKDTGYETDDLVRSL